jgi:preprotein translocase subunit SecF
MAPMRAIFTNTSYDFIGKHRWAYAVSVLVMLLGLGSMYVKGGLRYDIDFTGGTLVELRLAQPTPLTTIRSRLTAVGLGDSIIQVFDDPRDVLVRRTSARRPRQS